MKKTTLTPQQQDDIRRRCKEGEAASELAKEYKICYERAKSIAIGRDYKTPSRIKITKRIERIDPDMNWGIPDMWV